jgi:threonine synthase
MHAVRLECISCRATYSLNEKVIVCGKCGDVLDIIYDLDDTARKPDKEFLDSKVKSLWRYRRLLPVDREELAVSLGEGLTPSTKAPRYASSIAVDDLTLKLDYLNPTGSFKDRGTTVSVSKLRELGISRVMDDSSGNAGSSLAAYCAAAGIDCTLYVPAGAPSEKLLQAEIYGAKIVKIAETRTQVADATQEAWKASDLYYASHNLSPFFFEGMKTLAYEIAEDLAWRVPEHVVFPVGGGALLAGAWKGFRELVQHGWTDRVPKLHCIQSEACMPIVDAFRRGNMRVSPALERETVAGGIRISNPARGGQVLEALRRTRGQAESVADEAIFKHQRLLAAREGIFAEPTSCAALAGLEILRQMGIIGNYESVVVPLTGFGLKDSSSAAKALALHT